MKEQYVIENRISKITPKKIGQFVSIWKRDQNGNTAPFDSTDNIDFLVITSIKENMIGRFVFPKSILIEKGIISINSKGGKRGIRVYPSWDVPLNKQAIKTQAWQLKYFSLINRQYAAK